MNPLPPSQQRLPSVDRVLGWQSMQLLIETQALAERTATELLRVLGPRAEVRIEERRLRLDRRVLEDERGFVAQLARLEFR